jgi:chaperonin cofactor prefoldin
MFFGKGGGDARKVREEDLYALLNSSFDGKLKQFGSAANSCTRELNLAKGHYERACKEFAALQEEPEIENPYVNYASSLKDQKNSYAATLMRILHSWDSEPGEGPNLYEQYSAMLARTNDFIKETLQSNSKFKYVLYTYGRHFNNFKRSFALLERSRDALARELDNAGGLLSEYNEINGKLAYLHALNGEKGVISSMIASIRDSKIGGLEVPEIEEQRLAGEELAHKKTLEHLKSEINALTGGINRLMSQIEKPAKKFDHMSAAKVQLESFVEDIISKIDSEESNAKFKGMLGELNKALETGTIEAKNKEKAAEAIAELMSTDLYGLVLSVKSLEERKKEEEHELNLMHDAISHIRDTKDSAARVESKLSEMQKSESDINSKIDSAKSAIEKLFLDCYKQRIKIAD